MRSHRSQTLEKGEWSKYTEKGQEVRESARCGGERKRGERRKEREKENRRSERHREEKINTRENTFLAPGLSKEILIHLWVFLRFPAEF